MEQSQIIDTLETYQTAQNEMAIPRCRRLTSRLQGIPTLVVTT